MTRDEILYYLRSCLRNLKELQEVTSDTFQPSIGSETLADNVDWLECYIESLSAQPAGEPSEETERLWRDLLEKDDRTSPAEYPDMALITHDEFVAVHAAGFAAAREKAAEHVKVTFGPCELAREFRALKDE